MPAWSLVDAYDDQTADHVCETGGCRGLPLMDAGVDRRREVIAITRYLDHRSRTLAEVKGPPAKQRCVEGHRRIAIGRVKIAEVPGSGRIRELRAPPTTGLPEPKFGTERVGARGGTAS